MKKAIVLSSFITTVFLIIAAAPNRSSSGSPASHTGAPGENNCATSGCHDDGKLNSGTATLSVEMGNKLTDYVAGKTYPVKIKVTDPNKTRFGFQIVALDSKTNENIGAFQITDSERTQTVRNTDSFADRNYVTYTFKGTDAVSNGQGEWTVNWTAPASGKSPITFYVAAVSANDDMTDKGDQVYTSSLTVKN